jgi:aromatic-L-amino-acid decarboxylase
MIGFVKLRILDTDENFTLRGVPLAKAMEEDRALGLVPFFVSATLGTTSCCSFDALNEIGPICQSEGNLPTVFLSLKFIAIFFSIKSKAV